MHYKSCTVLLVPTKTN